MTVVTLNCSPGLMYRTPATPRIPQPTVLSMLSVRTSTFSPSSSAGKSSVGKAMPLSVYVHIPFCESLCYYCACNKIITKHHDRADVYLRYLNREIELHTAHCGVGQMVSQIHLGGGTPTFLSDEGLRDLMGMLRSHFTLVPGANIRSRSIPVPWMQIGWPCCTSWDSIA